MTNRIWMWAVVRMRALAKDERAASMVEYGLLIAVAVLVILVAFQNFANAFSDATNFITNEINEAMNS